MKETCLAQCTLATTHMFSDGREGFTLDKLQLIRALVPCTSIRTLDERIVGFLVSCELVKNRRVKVLASIESQYLGTYLVPAFEQVTRTDGHSVLRMPYVLVTPSPADPSLSPLSTTIVASSIREYVEGEPVSFHFHAQEGGPSRLVVCATNEGGYNRTAVDVEDVLLYVYTHFHDVWERVQGIEA